MAETGSRDTDAVDVVVVGAGFAGLGAARALILAGMSVAVLEARDRPGGRVDAAELAPGHPVDMGAGFIGDTQADMLALAHELGFEPVAAAAPPGEDLRTGPDGGIERSDGSYSAEALELVREIERLATEIPLDAPWEAEGVARLDSVSFAEWLEAQAGARALAELGPMAHRFMGDLTKISLLHALFYSRSNGGFGSFLGIGDKHDSLELRGSAHGLARRAAEALGDVVRYGVEVGKIVDDGGGVTVATNEGRVTARRCVVACPPAAAGAIAYEPGIDRERAELMGRMELFSQVKAQILYSRPFWADDGLSGTAISPAIETMPSAIAPDGLAGLIAFSWRDEETSRLEALAPEQRRAEVLAAIGELFGETAREPIAYVDRTWSDDRWSRGCVVRMPPGVWTGPGLAMRRPSGRVHWAGTETATVFCGQMEGALRSGKRAGEEILAAES